MIVAESLLQRTKLGVTSRKSLDRGDLMAVGLHRQHQAGTCGEAIEQDGAGAADAMLAAKMRACQTKRVAQEIRQRQPHLGLGLISLAVDGHPDLACLAHQLLPNASWLLPFSGWAAEHAPARLPVVTLRLRDAAGKMPARGCRRWPRACGRTRRHRAAIYHRSDLARPAPA